MVTGLNISRRRLLLEDHVPGRIHNPHYLIVIIIMMIEILLLLTVMMMTIITINNHVNHVSHVNHDQEIRVDHLTRIEMIDTCVCTRPIHLIDECDRYKCPQGTGRQEG